MSTCLPFLLPAINSVLSWFKSLSVGDWWAYGSAFLVLLGVIGETITDLTKWIKEGLTKEKIKVASALVLVLGLTGDIISIHITRKEEARIIRDAGDAETSARTAKDLADKIADRAEHLSWLMDAWAKQINFRQLDTKRFVDLMKGKRQGSAEIRYVPDDTEAEIFAGQIQQALKGSGWKVTRPIALPVLRGSQLEFRKNRTLLEELRLLANQGLSLAARNIDRFSIGNLTGPFLDALQKSLSTFSYSAQVLQEPSIPNDHLVIVVGHRWLSVPNPDFLHSKP